jgi:hypothetical protein
MRPGRVDPLAVAGGKGADVAVEGERLRHGAEQMKPHDPCRLRVPRDAAARHQRLHLAREPEGPAVVGDIERLDAIGVARQEKALAEAVPDGEGVHAAQAPRHRRPVQGVEVQQRLGVGRGAEPAALRLDLGAQGGQVVDLAVEDDDEPAVLAGHRLGGALGQVDDR